MLSCASVVRKEIWRGGGVPFWDTSQAEYAAFPVLKQVFPLVLNKRNDCRALKIICDITGKFSRADVQIVQHYVMTW